MKSHNELAKSDIKVENNLLDDELFEDLVFRMTNTEFPWYFLPYNDFSGEHTGLNNYQFEHWFFFSSIWQESSEYIDMLHPIIEHIDPVAFWRIKANLLTYTPEIQTNNYHIDIGNLRDNEEKLEQWTTSIYYLNSNNGYTEFEDGTRIESVGNRIITFPAHLKHRGTTCSDAKIRVVINFDYLHARKTNV